IFPLIKQVVETANKELRGFGMRLIAAEDYVCVIAFADIFGAPEANLGVTKRARHDPHLRISVEGGEIATMILHGSSTSTPKRMLPANFQLPQVEDAVAQFVRGLWARKRPNRPPVSTRLVSPSRAGGFPLMVAAAEVSACVAQQLRANGRIRVCPEHNSARPAAWGPTDHIAPPPVAGHPTR